MEVRQTTSARVDFCTRQLLKGHSASRVVADLADQQGISRRSARRYVHRAYGQIVEDLEEAGIDRKEVVAQTVHLLQEGAAKALEIGHVSAMVGACRELRELVGLGPNNQPGPSYRTGRLNS